MRRASATVHFPFIEAGRPKPLCAAPHASLDWTTAPEKVTCPRCRQLLLGSVAGELAERGAERASGAQHA
jgi:hypothetical protein